ncbi:hypothetical protein P615_18280 [Brevibacillus laterosporus PE36]|nr:hypothetical protein P615_18280 [Brevibacillus laterosporus PE36]
MQEVTCIVVGGGYAGINAIKAIRKTFAKSQFLQSSPDTD